MAGGNGLRGLAPELAKRGVVIPADPRLLRLKAVAVTIRLLASFLTMDGTFAVKMEGWPEGAETMGLIMGQLDSGEPAVMLLLHHPSFPLVETGKVPPLLGISWRKIDMPAESAENAEG